MKRDGRAVPGASWVAPRAGAWIETSDACTAFIANRVAPRAGAWIETSTMPRECEPPSGRPPRGGVD